jgi:hypothetical protein
MHSVLTIDSPATSHDLTTLAAVKAELGITDTTEDGNLAVWITAASQAAEAYCDRVFVEETVTETFRNRRGINLDGLVLARSPLSELISVTADGETLTEDVEFEQDPGSAILYRISNGKSCHWRFTSLVANYKAGFPADKIPVNLARAALVMVKLLRGSATRDPAVKSENMLGTYSYTLFGGADIHEGMPADVAALLSPYRNISV